MHDILYTLSPLERKVLPHVTRSVKEIEKLTSLDETSVIRALKFLENKKIIEIHTSRTTSIILGTNGIYYKKNSLPERTLISVIEKNNHLSLEEAMKVAKLSENEFKAALGVLKRKGLISFQNGKLSLSISKTELAKKFPEEQLIESLPRELETLDEQERVTLANLKNRKDIVQLEEKKELRATLTDLGKKIEHEKIETDLIEEVTPALIKSGVKNKEFRRYDIQANVPKLQGGKRHFVNLARDYAKKVWIEMGFKEMQGPMVDSSFWVFDSLFTAQDHQVREMQDTFYLKGKFAELPEKKLIENIKKAHEGKLTGKGWSTSWSEEDAKRVVLRTHTTSLTAHKLASLSQSEIPSKWFAIGKAFRNETIDWSHNIEFFQTEGIVIGENLTLRHLIGYLKAFYAKMNFPDIRVRPSFFPYTEPSLEIEVYHAEKKQWLELGGAGILRPEVTLPLLGKPLTVLAWGQGLDRMIMDAYKIKDLRELYMNDLPLLRDKKLAFV